MRQIKTFPPPILLLLMAIPEALPVSKSLPPRLLPLAADAGSPTNQPGRATASSALAAPLGRGPQGQGRRTAENKNNIYENDF